MQDDAIPEEAWNGWEDSSEGTRDSAAPLSMSGAIAEGIVPLGHDRGVFYYLSQSARQVFGLQASQHSKTSLMAMASMSHYWQRSRFVTDKGAIRWDDAIDHLMSECRSVGIYDPDRVRGRGAWLDNGRAVLHVGDRLVVDGAQGELVLSESRHIYEAAPRLTTELREPLSNADSHKLMAICQSLRWQVGVDGVLLAGFLAIAPVCGALSWRPSVWITGGAGSGKSYLVERIVAPSIGGIALQVQSKTSEAGLRQILGCDARPVLFDEAESEDQGAAVRMQGVLDLVRQSASEGGAEIVKGSANGRAQRFRIRSCFLFSSINTAIRQQADFGRITVLELREPLTMTEEGRLQEAAKFAELNNAVTTTITPEYAGGLLSRAVLLLPVIRQNAEIFAQAAATELGSRRDGDQLGALLAGAYSLHSDRVISPEQAIEYVRRHEWTQIGSHETERDEYQLLSHLTQHRIRMAQGNGSAVETTIGRLMAAVADHDSQIIPENADKELLQIGMRYASDEGNNKGFWISNTHPAIASALRGTPWSARWERALRRLPGTDRSQSAYRFSTGHIARATWLPWSLIHGE